MVYLILVVMAQPVDYLSSRSGPLRGELLVPGDKSISHRAIMLASLAEGVSRISGFLESADTLATVTAFRRMGVQIETPGVGECLVHGVGLWGLQLPDEPIDCGNSGTTMRLLTGILAGQNFDSMLTGDASLSRRPMRRVIEPLCLMGAQIEAESGNFPPLRIYGGKVLRGIHYHAPIASAQVKSAVLLAGLYAQGETRVYEAQPTRDYTERMLAARGWPLSFRPGELFINKGKYLQNTEITIPADFSSAAFFLVAALLLPGSELRICSVGINPRRIGLLSTLRAMGADIQIDNVSNSGGELVADLFVQHAPLHGVEVPLEWVPDMIDELPVLFIAAAAAQGKTVVRGAAELRVKESDRIAVMATGLRALGVRVQEIADGMLIEGGVLQGGEVDTAGDHRCAMSFAIAGLVAEAPIKIRNCANVATSFPRFVTLAHSLRLQINEIFPQ